VTPLRDRRASSWTWPLCTSAAVLVQRSLLIYITLTHRPLVGNDTVLILLCSTECRLLISFLCFFKIFLCRLRRLVNYMLFDRSLVWLCHGCTVTAACSNKCGSTQYEVTPCVGTMERKCDGKDINVHFNLLLRYNGPIQAIFLPCCKRYFWYSRQNCFWRGGFTSDVNQVYTNLVIRSRSLPDEENWFKFIWFCRKQIIYETAPNG